MEGFFNNKLFLVKILIKMVNYKKNEKILSEGEGKG